MAKATSFVECRVLFFSVLMQHELVSDWRRVFLSPPQPFQWHCRCLTVLRPWASAISVCWELPLSPHACICNLGIQMFGLFLCGFCFFVCLGGQKLEKSTWVLCSEPCLVWSRSRTPWTLGGGMGHSAFCLFRFFKGGGIKGVNLWRGFILSFHAWGPGHGPVGQNIWDTPKEDIQP